MMLTSVWIVEWQIYGEKWLPCYGTASPTPALAWELIRGAIQRGQEEDFRVVEYRRVEDDDKRHACSCGEPGRPVAGVCSTLYKPGGELSAVDGDVVPGAGGEVYTRAT